mgnify:CR=1 FL=1
MKPLGNLPMHEASKVRGQQAGNFVCRAACLLVRGPWMLLPTSNCSSATQKLSAHQPVVAVQRLSVLPCWV